MELVDPLRVKSYGIKKDKSQKAENLKTIDDDNRRWYPVDYKGRVDEWGAVVKLQTEIFQKEQEIGKEMKQMQSKSYMTELDQMRYRQLQEKQSELDKKKVEYEEVMVKKRNFEEFNENKKQEEKLFQQYLADQYDSNMKLLKQKEGEAKRTMQYEEQGRIERAQRELEEMRQRQISKFRKFGEEQKELLEYKDYLKKGEEDRKLESKKESAQLFEQNAQREIKNEQNYKQIFVDFDNKLQKQMRNYQEKALSPQQEKDYRMREIIDNNEKERNRQLKEKETMDNERRKNNQRYTQDTQKNQMGEKEAQKEREKEAYQRYCEEVKKRSDDYQEQVRRQKEEDSRQKKVYADTLEMQKNWKDAAKNQYGNMTQNEKLLNKNDLQAFKNYETRVSGMVPGQRTSMYNGSPILKGAQDMVLSNSTSARELPKMASILAKRGSEGAYESNKEQRRSISPTNNGSYNPITNPIPSYNQNPYMSKERMMVSGNFAGMGSNKSVLQSMAENNLIK